MRQIMRSSLDYAEFAQLCGRSPIMREIMRAHNRIIPRSLDSSHMTASSSASWSRFSPPSNFVNGHVSTMWFMVMGETPFVQVSTTWALTCPETVHQGPHMTREIQNWLSDSRIGNNSVVEHRSRRPVLSPLRNCVDIICHVWPYWASRCKPWRWMLKDISIHRPIWTGFGDLKLRCHWFPMTPEFVAFCPTQRWTRVESVRGLGWVQQRCAGLGVTTARDEDCRLTVWITYFVWLCYPASELPCYKKLIDW